MTSERRLIEAFRATGEYEPNPNLYARVVHSIEEDRLHRARIRGATAAVAMVAALLVAVGAFSVQTTRFGEALRYRIDLWMLELLETFALAMLVLVLGPTIRRFGRGYVGDIFGEAAETGVRLIQLVDVAYYMLFSGYVLVTTRFTAPTAYHLYAIADQVEESAARIGGLLLVMGLLHATALMALPLIGLVFTANRREAKLPRWVTILIVTIVIVGGGVLVTRPLPALFLGL